MSGLAGFATEHARNTLFTVSRIAGMHIELHVQAKAVEAARGEAPQKGNTMKVSAIRAWGVAIIAATGLMGATGAQAEKTLVGASSFNTNECRCRQCEFNPLTSTHTLAFQADCRRKALSGCFGKFVTALGRRAASAVL